MKTLTPGEIASYCDVHQRTVSRWIASGQLKGFKLPGRGNYRVVLEDFICFLNQQKIPVADSLTTTTTVLVVDDEVAYRRAIFRVLQQGGFHVIQAQDGFQAGLLLVQHKPAVMTLDLQMPGLDGFEVLKYIREHPELNQTKILVISGLAQSELDRAKACGANAILSKPFDNPRLLEAIQQLINE
jgi:excisionase family DNA binding protein